MPSQQDDLTKIKGISEVRQEWFAETFQVVTFQKLADLSPEEIQQTFKQQGKGVSLRAIESWVAQAREFAEETAVTEAADSLTAVESSPPLMVPNRKDGWKPFASFVVEFQKNEAGDYQMMAHFMEQDLSERWAGVEAEQVCSWMQEIVDVPVMQPVAAGTISNVGGAVVTAVSPPPAAPTPAKKKAKSALAAHIEIDTVTILDEQGSPPANIISHEHDWQIQVAWTLDDGDSFPENGRWLVNAFLESIGSGPDYALAAKEITKLSNGSNQQKYIAKIAIRANDPGTVRAGLYKMVVVIRAQVENNVVLPLASFKDQGMLSVY